MKSNLVKAALFLSSLWISSLSYAGLMVDYEWVLEYASEGDTVSWTHDLTSQGFVPGSASHAILSVWFFDFDRQEETAEITFGLGESATPTINNFTFSAWNGLLGANSLFDFNASGLLNVSVTSTAGDFLVKKSILSVITNDKPGKTAKVFEPATFGLLSLGLAGVVALRRNRRQ